MIAIVDYKMGNSGSVKNALEFLGFEAKVSDRAEDFRQASHIILPGVGSFADGMRNLKQLPSFSVLEEEVRSRKKPFLGICLGMQICAEEGIEGGLNRGLGWIKGRVEKFRVDEKAFRLPHVGWNDVSPRPESRLFHGITQPVFYFVHSFIFKPLDASAVAAEAEYGEKFAAALEQENIFGVQFHPEKSQREGLKLLANFLGMA